MNIPGPCRRAHLHPVWHTEDHRARTALSFIPRPLQNCSGNRRAHISHNLIHISSVSSPHSTSRTEREVPAAPLPDPPARTHPPVLSCCFCQGVWTQLEGKLWPPGVSIITTWVAASSCRQTITWAWRPGSHGSGGRIPEWNRAFPPHKDSVRVFYFFSEN